MLQDIQKRKVTVDYIARVAQIMPVKVLDFLTHVNKLGLEISQPRKERKGNDSSRGDNESNRAVERRKISLIGVEGESLLKDLYGLSRALEVTITTRTVKVP